MKSQKITWLHGACSYAERHEMSAAERIAAESRALAMSDETDAEIIVTVCDVSAIVEARTISKLIHDAPANCAGRGGLGAEVNATSMVSAAPGDGSVRTGLQSTNQ